MVSFCKFIYITGVSLARKLAFSCVNLGGFQAHSKTGWFSWVFTHPKTFRHGRFSSGAAVIPEPRAARNSAFAYHSFTLPHLVPALARRRTWCTARRAQRNGPVVSVATPRARAAGLILKPGGGGVTQAWPSQPRSRLVVPVHVGSRLAYSGSPTYTPIPGQT